MKTVFLYLMFFTLLTTGCQQNKPYQEDAQLKAKSDKSNVPQDGLFIEEISQNSPIAGEVDKKPVRSAVIDYIKQNHKGEKVYGTSMYSCKGNLYICDVDCGKRTYTVAVRMFVRDDNTVYWKVYDKPSKLHMIFLNRSLSDYPYSEENTQNESDTSE